MRIQQKNFQYYPEILTTKITSENQDVRYVKASYVIRKGQLQAIRSDNIPQVHSQPFVQGLLEQEKRIINAA